MALPTPKTNQFPRAPSLPSQSSKYWVKEKDRHLRQLLLSDIEQSTGRSAVVYYASPLEGIIHRDADDLSEVLEGINSDTIDLIIHTQGGGVEAVEKYITVLSKRINNYRVIVPNTAKSGGTLIALSSEKILLGVNSELGPIDPQMYLPNTDRLRMFPCEFISRDETQPPLLRKLAEKAVDGTNALAKKCLSEGMLKGKQDREIDNVIKKISSPENYGSHSSVIDFSEAEELGLSVEWMGPESELWKRVWLLHCLYEFDANAWNIGRICEGVKNSIAWLKTPSQ